MRLVSRLAIIAVAAAIPLASAPPSAPTYQQFLNPDSPQEPDLYGRRRADDSVHRRCHERKIEAEGINLPGDIDVLGVPGTPARDYCDVIEAVGLSP